MSELEKTRDLLRVATTMLSDLVEIDKENRFFVVGDHVRENISRYVVLIALANKLLDKAAQQAEPE